MRGLIQNNSISRVDRNRLKVTDKGWVPKARWLPNERPNKSLKVPRYLLPHASHLTKLFPKTITRIIMGFAFLIGPRSMLNATVIHDYNVAGRFYKAVLYGGLRVSETLMWLPMPYLHPLRVEAIERFIDMSDVPWVNNEGESGLCN